LRELERQLTTLSAEYKDTYPDIIQLKQEIAQVKVQVAATRRLTDGLSISKRYTYNRSYAVKGATSVAGTFFESYSGFGGVASRLSARYLASLSYQAGTFHGNYFASEVQSFGRNAVTLTISES
jgi:hypothetical protein